MTKATGSSELVEVTEADQKCRRQWYRDWYACEGARDALDEAFARHRIAASADLETRLARAKAPAPQPDNALADDVVERAAELRDVVMPVISACLLMQSDDPKLAHPRLGVAAEVANAVAKHLSALSSTPATPFQDRVKAWMYECFPASVCNDRLERRDRLVEETLELAQTLPDFTADRAHALVDYVFNRPRGVTEQEVGGVSVTLAALCVAEGIDQLHWAEVELARISTPETIAKIREKQATKPVGSALPIAMPEPPKTDLRAENATLAASPIRLLEAVLTDDPNWVCAGIPDKAIEDGIAKWDQIQSEMDEANYVSGETTDWDEGMIVSAIFKTVARSILGGEG